MALSKKELEARKAKIDASKPAPEPVVAPVQEAMFTLTDDDLPVKEAGIGFKIPLHDRKALREWCARHDMTVKEIFYAGWEHLKSKKGP